MAGRSAGSRIGRSARAPSHVVPGRLGPESRMVDLGEKPVTRRSALARARVVFPPGVRATLLAGRGPKGPVLEVARTAAVLAAKRTDELVPLCHTLPLDALEVEFRPRGRNELEVRVRAATTGRTGVEMEALVGAAAAALTLYDMGKALDHGIRIERIELLEKSGGRSGTWRARATRR
ncbi:MAG: cyclic pyranopterin monophosphate synthase MoaC [Planctomycetes bacterium]|nr:cyclic pyranopterin monophosphate synthase MoaC [Planctomycetota bacterium]